jgi:hypothetical protein
MEMTDFSNNSTTFVDYRARVSCTPLLGIASTLQFQIGCPATEVEMAHRIFISSVCTGNFQGYRKCVADVIGDLQREGFDVSAIRIPEAPPPRYIALSSEHACLAGVRDAVLYIGIYGQYHSAIVEKEYDEARSHQKPCAIFLTNEEAVDPGQKRFLYRVESFQEGTLHPVRFNSETDLKYQVRDLLPGILRDACGIDPISIPLHHELASSQSNHILKECSYVLSAPTCLFLCGDWSVLISKLAILAPCHLRVTVGIKSAQGNTDGLHLYAYEQLGGSWVKNDYYAQLVQVKLSEAIKGAAEFPDILPFVRRLLGKNIYVFSEAPFGSLLHEVEAAIFCIADFALHEKMEEPQHNTEDDGHHTRVMAVYLLSYWYKVVSWATCFASAFVGCMSDKVMFFDRTDDDKLDFCRILNEDIGYAEYKRNLGLSAAHFHIKWLPFDLSRISVLFRECPKVDIPFLQMTLKHGLGKLVKAQFTKIAREMRDAIMVSDYVKVGMLMSLHHALLSAEGFSSEEHERLFKQIQAHKDVLGVKFSCSRRQGAIVVLHEPGFKTRNVFGCQTLAEGLQPCNGFARISSASAALGQPS